MIFNFGSQAVSLWTWLGPLLLFGASLAATGVAFLGILKSNKTNREAIAAADNRAKDDRADARQRDFDTWRRDAIAKAAVDAMNAAVQAYECYSTSPGRMRSLASQGDPLETVTNAAWLIFTSAQVLGLIGAKHAAAQCFHMRNAVVDNRLREYAAQLAKGGDPEVQKRFDKLREGIMTPRSYNFAVAIEEELRRSAPNLIEFPSLQDQLRQK